MAAASNSKTRLGIKEEKREGERRRALPINEHKEFSLIETNILNNYKK